MLFQIGSIIERKNMSQTAQHNFFNAPNIVLKNFFSKQELDTINNSINEDTPGQHVPHLGYWAYHISLPDYIIEKVTKIASELMNEEMVLAEYQVGLYKNFNLENAKSHPVLFPHVDKAFKEPRFSIDALLDTNIEWPVEVDAGDDVISLSAEISDALTFSGTHQYHWRPKRDFSENEFIQLLFMHFKSKNAVVIPEEESAYIDSLEMKLIDKWLATPGKNFNK